MNRLYFVAAIPLAVCVIPLVISLLSKWEDTIVRNSANGLVVLSGMLAALAILVPLGATLPPEPSKPRLGRMVFDRGPAHGRCLCVRHNLLHAHVAGRGYL